jgi:hypothetical protein
MFRKSSRRSRFLLANPVKKTKLKRHDSSSRHSILEKILDAGYDVLSAAGKGILDAGFALCYIRFYRFKLNSKLFLLK